MGSKKKQVGFNYFFHLRFYSIDIHLFTELNIYMSGSKLLQAILDKVSSVDKKVDKGFKIMNKRMDKTDKRIDKLGLQIARIEDDAPTIEEFDDLEKRVSTIEQHTTSV